MANVLQAITLLTQHFQVIMSSRPICIGIRYVYVAIHTGFDYSLIPAKSGLGGDNFESDYNYRIYAIHRQQSEATASRDLLMTDTLMISQTGTYPITDCFTLLIDRTR